MATRRSVLTAIAGAAIGLPSDWARRRAAKISGPADQDDRAVSAGRPDRHHGADDGAGIDQPRRPGGRRESSRRRFDHRHQGRRRRGPRRLHPDVRLLGFARRGAGPVFQSRPRSTQGVRPNRHGGAVAAHLCRQQRRAGKIDRRIRRLCQGQSGQDQLRRGARHAAASALDLVQDRSQDRRGLRALYRLGAIGERPARRPDPIHHRRPGDALSADRGRQAAGARHRARRALAGAARRADAR